MKKIKILILFLFMCCLCSFATPLSTSRATNTFTVDFKTSLERVNGGTKINTHKFTYGQKFAICYNNVNEPIPDARDMHLFLGTHNTTKNNYVQINSKADLVYLNDVYSNFDVPAEQSYAILPIDKLTTNLYYFYNAHDICDISFGVDLTMEEDLWHNDLIATQINERLKPEASDDASVDTKVPVLNNHHGMFITNVNNPVTEASIRTHIKAVDDVDGDITSNIVVSEDTYTQNKSKVGDYVIKYSVSDKAQNTAYLFVHVKVVDTDKPVFSGPTTETSNLSNPVPYSEIISRVTVSDNYDKNLTIVDDDTQAYQQNMNKVGTYLIRFTCKDSSNNSATHELVVTVKDDIPPVISGSASFTTSPQNKISIDTIKNSLTITENCDPKPTKTDIKVDSDTYSANYNKVGTYQISFSVTDSNGNKSKSFVVTINVVDNTLPVFYVDKFIVNCDPSVSLSYEDIFGILKECNTIDFSKISDVEKQIVITYDDYKNSMEEGTYNMGFKVSYDDGMTYDLTLVINKEILKPISLPWYSRLYYSIVHYSIVINDFIDNLFTSIRNFFYELFH